MGVHLPAVREHVAVVHAVRSRASRSGRLGRVVRDRLREGPDGQALALAHDLVEGVQGGGEIGDLDQPAGAAVVVLGRHLAAVPAAAGLREDLVGAQGPQTLLDRGVEVPD